VIDMVDRQIGEVANPTFGIVVKREFGEFGEFDRIRAGGEQHATEKQLCHQRQRGSPHSDGSSRHDVESRTGQDE